MLECWKLKLYHNQSDLHFWDILGNLILQQKIYCFINVVNSFFVTLPIVKHFGNIREYYATFYLDSMFFYIFLNFTALSHLYLHLAAIYIYENTFGLFHSPIGTLFDYFFCVVCWINGLHVCLFELCSNSKKLNWIIYHILMSFY